MSKLKSPLTIRSDNMYCPLPLSIDSYSNCETDCNHCFFRRLNYVWGQDLKEADLDLLKKKLENGLKNNSPKSGLAWAIKNKLTIRIGNKADPFQPIENKRNVTKKIIDLLTELEWSFVIQTRHTTNLLQAKKHVLRAHKRGLVVLMPVISPGLDFDWEILEKGLTTPPEQRLKDMKRFMKKGIQVGVNGEPFIPSVHSFKSFKDTLLLLKKYKINRYNTYHLHFNDYVAKRLHELNNPRIDIEKIWKYNQDGEWRKILRKLMEISDKMNIKLGCPDFVNTGWDRKEPANTCCGIDVPNPSKYNTHYFKSLKQSGMSDEGIMEACYNGCNTREVGMSVLNGKSDTQYSLNDII
jgi:DNA repair photolyase